MAKNLVELELQLSQLRNRRQELVNGLRADVTGLQESLKPMNLLKRGLNTLLSDKTSQNVMISSAAGLVGSMLLGGKGGLAKLLASRLAESDMVKDLIEKEKPRINRWIDKVKSLLSGKDKEPASE